MSNSRISTDEETVQSEWPEFRKFYSIENTYMAEFIEKCKEKVNPEEKWCVTEKVHGANFSFISNGADVICAKRTAYITDKELDTFYNCGEVLEAHKEKIIKLFNLLKSEHPYMTHVIVYGELFGGFYEGVVPNNKITPIQKGVQYHDQHVFMAFDIAIYVNMYSHHITTYIDYDRAIEYFKTCEIFYASILFEGGMDECITWSSSHNTDVTGIPQLLYGDSYQEVTNNIREGNVIKPIKHHYLQTGSSVVLKDKNEQFKEVSGFKKLTLQSDDTTKQLRKTALSYVTEQRLNGVISKHGPLTQENKGAYIGYFCCDAIEDFVKEHSEHAELIKQMKRDFNKAVMQSCRNMIMRRVNK
jgi:Rnl2 family RNA ligase